MKNTLPPLAGLLCISFALVLSANTGCANISSPTGGPRDTLAPQVVSAEPENFSTYFSAGEIELTFNEYLSLKNPSQQLLISPPIAGKLKTELRGKRLVISWTDTLRANTTYTINFGNALQDLTEGNPQETYRYVFSTGGVLDSMRLSGSVKNMRSKEGEKQWRVMLYEPIDSLPWDTLPLVERPVYYTLTSEKGAYTLENLRPGRYHMLATSDDNNDLKYAPAREGVAFLTELIQVSDSTQPNTLWSSMEKKPFRYYGSKSIGLGQIEVAFSSRPNDLVVAVETDTLVNAWFDPGSRDTLRLYHAGGAPDSLKMYFSSGEWTDTTTLYRLLDKDPAPLVIASIPQRHLPDSLFHVIWNHPLAEVKNDRFNWVVDGDTLPAIPTEPMGNQLTFELPPPAKPGAQLLWLAFPGAASDLLSQELADTLSKKVQLLTAEDVGELKLTVKLDEADLELPYRVKLQSSNYTLELPAAAFNNRTLKNLMPGKYKLYLYLDSNGNGSWDPASFQEQRQPEAFYTYPDAIDLRANWELEITWKIPATPR